MFTKEIQYTSLDNSSCTSNEEAPLETSVPPAHGRIFSVRCILAVSAFLSCSIVSFYAGRHGVHARHECEISMSTIPRNDPYYSLSYHIFKKNLIDTNLYS